MDIRDIAYTVRRSKRAKYISMRIIPDQGLELILPVGASERQGHSFLIKNKTWLAKHAALLSPESIHAEKKRYELITEINLRCIERVIAVRYIRVSSQRVKLLHPLPDVLVVTGAVNDARCCQTQLDSWLKKQGARYLLPMLKRLSEQTGLIYNNASIRLQRGRWGSCSAAGNISLNARLLYLPNDVARYVLIHELCHLKELNHSQRFWRLVESFEPRYRELKKMLY